MLEDIIQDLYIVIDLKKELLTLFNTKLEFNLIKSKFEIYQIYCDELYSNALKQHNNNEISYRTFKQVKDFYMTKNYELKNIENYLVKYEIKKASLN